MSFSGNGRGRGWLNLSKNADPPRPVGISKPALNNLTPIHQSSDEYKEIIEKIREVNLNDDGILFNRKLKNIKDCWMQACNSQEEVESSFEGLYNKCLHDCDLASKLVSLVGSPSFISQEIHQCNIRHLFLKYLQRDFENGSHLQLKNPLMFRNCVYMIGQFYHKARLSNGEQFKFLATPFLTCLELLLSSKTLPDLMLFTTQWFLNGNSLKSSQPDELSALTMKIRSTLVNKSQLATEEKLWLLLALDLLNVKFGVLQPDVYKFYEEHLGPKSMVNFQTPSDTLSIETLHSCKELDSFESKVNVLQISSSPVDKVPHSQFANNSVELNSVKKSDTTAKAKEKAGRPILGVGARFANTKTNDENGSWNCKQNETRWAHQKPPPAFKSNKGWEHDDRFENDYN